MKITKANEGGALCFPAPGMLLVTIDETPSKRLNGKGATSRRFRDPLAPRMGPIVES